MCGIVGMAGNLGHNHGKMFRDMLVFDTVRGFDSTGIVQVPLTSYAKNALPKLPIMEKDIGPPQQLWEFYKSDIFDYRGHIKALSRVLIGHNRAATVGKINVENAHPFKFKDVYGVHNGSLRFYQDLDGYTDHDVDSKCLLETIANKGIKQTWKLFTGAAALVWWDEHKQTINFIRNKERPLYIGYGEKEDIIFWASEPWMIRVAADRNGVKLLKNKEGITKVCYFEEDNHYEYEVSNTGYKMLAKEKLEGRVFQWPTQTNGSNGMAMGVGFKTTNNSSKVRSRQLNSGWAKSMERGEKDSRGITIELTHMLDAGDRFIARAVSDGPVGPHDTIFVYAANHFQKQQLIKAFESKSRKFKTIARMRFENRSYTNRNYKKWGVSSSGLKPVVSASNKPNLAVVVDNKPDDLPRFKTYNGDYVSRAKWVENITSGNFGKFCGCAWCSEHLDPEDCEQMVFLSKHDVLCPYCSKKEEVNENLYYIYPEAFQNRSKENVH